MGYFGLVSVVGATGNPEIVEPVRLRCPSCGAGYVLGLPASALALICARCGTHIQLRSN